MSEAGPAFWVRAEYSFILNVLELSDQMRVGGQSGAALLSAATEQIRERALPDDPQSRGAVSVEREAVLSIITDAARQPDPLGHALTHVSQRAQAWLR